MKSLFSYQGDLEKLKRLRGRASSPLKEQPIKTVGLEGIEVVVVNSPDRLEELQNLPRDRLIGIDIETTPIRGLNGDTKAGLDPHKSRTRLIQLFDGSGRVFVVDMDFVLPEAISSILAQLTLVAHNAVFELKHLIHSKIACPRMGCSMLLIHALTGKQMSLRDSVKEFLGLEIEKELQRSDWGATQLSMDQINYAALDAVLTLRLFHTVFSRVEKEGNLGCYRLMRNVQVAIAKMELAGFFFDVVGHKGILGEWNRDLIQQTVELQSVMGCGINFGSPQQVGSWIKSVLDPSIVLEWPKTKTGILKTDISSLSLFPEVSFTGPLIAYREKRKLITSYGAEFASHVSRVTGRLHASFRIAGTATGRLSCNTPNIQNPPRDPRFRKLFKAPDNRVLVVMDYSQIELRVAALIANDEAMLYAYKSGEDLHRKTAAALLGKDPLEITKEERQLAKAVNFGLLYGQGAKGLMRYAKQSYGVVIPEKQAEHARKAFFNLYPGLKKWQQLTSSMADVLGYVRTPTGRKRNLSSESNRYTESLNTPIQGGAAEVTLRALIRIERAIDWDKITLVNCVHDEVIIESDENCAESAKQIVENCMKDGFLDVFPQAQNQTHSLIDSHICKDWSGK